MKILNIKISKDIKKYNEKQKYDKSKYNNINLKKFLKKIKIS